MRLRSFSPLPWVVFSLVLGASSSEPFVHLLCSDDASCLDLRAVPSCFGARLPRAGLAGDLVEAVPGDACRPVAAPPASNRTSPGRVLLVRRHGCPLATKVLHAQQAGYRAALVHGLHSDLLPGVAAWPAPEAGQPARIPALLIGGSASKLLRRRLRSGKAVRVEAVVPRGYRDPCREGPECTVMGGSPRRCLRPWPGYCRPRAGLWFLEEFGFLASLGLVASSLLFAGWLKRRPAHHGPRAGAFRRGDPYELCVICRADFEAGDRLKVLPCAHAYHNACIDTWLLLQPRAGKSCPVCKRRVHGAD